MKFIWPEQGICEQDLSCTKGGSEFFYVLIKTVTIHLDKAIVDYYEIVH